MKMTAFIAALILAGTSARAAEGLWMNNFENARRVAGEKDLPILVDFSGSDWCGWCMRLDQEVFSSETFKRFAKENLVLFLADFPARKALPQEIVDQNRVLAEMYGVQGFPTVLLLDADGKLLARTGYQAGGAQRYVQHLKGLLEENKK